MALLSKLKVSFKQAAILSIASGFLAINLFSFIPTANALTASPGPRVSFTFDDALTSAITQAAPTLAQYGYTATEYVPTGCVGMTTAPNTCRADNQKTYMTWDQLAQLKNQYGWEIGSHTVSHPLLASTDPEDQPNLLTSQELINELANSKQTLASHGFNAQALATPYGDWNQSSLTEIAKYYTSHRPFADTIDQNADGVIEHGNGFPYNDYLLYVLPVQAGVSVATVKNYIDQSIASNQWLIMVFHDIGPNASTNPEDYEYQTSQLAEIAAYLKSKNVPGVNISDGLAGGTNLLPNSGFESGISSGWNTDSPSNITADSQNHGNTPSAANSVKGVSNTQNAHLFSPLIPIDPASSYFVKSFLNVTSINVAAGHEVSFYIDEYDLNGGYLTTQFKKAENSLWVANLNFEYKPTSANVKSARLQVVITANSGINAYFDNIGLFTQVLGSTSGKAGDINGDALVNALDLSILLTSWNKSATRAQGDLNGDGLANSVDLSILLTNWSK